MPPPRTLPTQLDRCFRLAAWLLVTVVLACLPARAENTTSPGPASDQTAGHGFPQGHANPAVESPEPDQSRSPVRAAERVASSPSNSPSASLFWPLAVAVLVMAAVNAGSLAALWFYLLRNMVGRLDRQRMGLQNLEAARDQMKSDLQDDRAEFTRVWEKLTELEKTSEQIVDQFLAKAEQPRPPAARPASIRTFSPPAEFAAGPRQPSVAQVQELAASALPPIRSAPARPTRQELGSLYLQEIRTGDGRDPGVVWENCLRKIQTYFPQARSQQVHWDRSSATPRFVERAAPSFTDTGECWLVQADAEALLFFPAMARPVARKNDIPGCQIISAGGALLDSAQLAEFTPPVVAPAVDGWTIHTEGIIEYH